ncbi:Hypothetical_protein [Hexamita inflata]|uniref:Hypothetical_protein n=1 Tax=Hexamita inflata TaxID=28002 RepID=A0AA86PC43_9EUKA|nr:Hypothetical protein HINF_LOCUS22691 [Hexamita inflata]
MTYYVLYDLHYIFSYSYNIRQNINIEITFTLQSQSSGSYLWDVSGSLIAPLQYLKLITRSHIVSSFNGNICRFCRIDIILYLICYLATQVMVKHTNCILHKEVEWKLGYYESVFSNSLDTIYRLFQLQTHYVSLEPNQPQHNKNRTNIFLIQIINKQLDIDLLEFFGENTVHASIQHDLFILLNQSLIANSYKIFIFRQIIENKKECLFIIQQITNYIISDMKIINNSHHDNGQYIGSKSQLLKLSGVTTQKRYVTTLTTVCQNIDFQKVATQLTRSPRATNQVEISVTAGISLGLRRIFFLNPAA